MLSNMELDKEKNRVLISLNPRIYPLDVVYSACYVFIDKAYVLLDGEPEEEIIVELKPKDESESIEKLGMEFSNELLNYAVYKRQSLANADIKTLIVQAALSAPKADQKEQKKDDISRPEK